MNFISQLTEPALALWLGLGNIEKSIAAIISGIILFYFLRFVVIRQFEKLSAKTENDLDDRLIHFIRQFLWVGIFIGTLVWVLTINGIAISPVLAGAGIFGVAVGFAAKETIADILSGIFLIIDRPIRIGDRVTIDKIGKHWGGWAIL